jgi:hypothetical protein
MVSKKLTGKNTIIPSPALKGIKQNREMIKRLRMAAIATLAALTMTACDKDDDKASVSRNVKYEITGNYTGKLNIVYTTASGSQTTETMVGVPWTKELTVNSNVQAVVLNASTSSTSTAGAAGQTITAKIYIGGHQKANGSSTAGADGRVNVPSIQFTY